MTTEAPLTTDEVPKSRLSGWENTGLLILIIVTIGIVSITMRWFVHEVAPSLTPATPQQDAQLLALRKTLEPRRSGDLVLVKTPKGEERIHAVMHAGTASFCTRDHIRADQYCVAMDSTEILAVQRICGAPNAPTKKDCAERFFNQ